MRAGAVEWTPAMDTRLRELYDTKLTFRVIADRMNADFGLALTRNACIGRGRRLFFPSRGGAPPPPVPKRTRKRKHWTRRKTEAKPKPVAPPLAPVEPVPGALTMLQLGRGTCRWPSGTKPPYTYCGEPVHGDRQYCLAHCQLAYANPERMRS